MFETVINLKPESEWRPGVTTDTLIAEMDKALQFPGVSTAWTMLNRNRTHILSTGIRTPDGVKVFETDLRAMESDVRQDEAENKPGLGQSHAHAGRLDGGQCFAI